MWDMQTRQIDLIKLIVRFLLPLPEIDTPSLKCTLQLTDLLWTEELLAIQSISTLNSLLVTNESRT